MSIPGSIHSPKEQVVQRTPPGQLLVTATSHEAEQEAIQARGPMSAVSLAERATSRTRAMGAYL